MGKYLQALSIWLALCHVMFGIVNEEFYFASTEIIWSVYFMYFSHFLQLLLIYIDNVFIQGNLETMWLYSSNICVAIVS